MMRSYMFLMDFLEAVTKETSSMLKSQQSLMRSLLEAAKVSEAKLNDFFSSNIEKVNCILSLPITTPAILIVVLSHLTLPV